MSDSASLPSYTSALPAYEAAGYARPALADRTNPRTAAGSFSKESKNGVLSLHLTAQDAHALVPTYGLGGTVEGSVRVSKSEGVHAVELKLDGLLVLREIAGGAGTHDKVLCQRHLRLWTAESQGAQCPRDLSFSIPLPCHFSDGQREYPLPPSYAARLQTMPGFDATVVFTLKAELVKTAPSQAKGLPGAGIFGKAFGLGNPAVATELIHAPRSRPAMPPPCPLSCDLASHGFGDAPGWAHFDSSIKCRLGGGQDVNVRLHLPRGRVFCMRRPIPFHLTFSASAFALAAFMPFAPTPARLGRSQTKITLVRHAVCNVSGENSAQSGSSLWRADKIGEAVFQRAGDGSDWISFHGRIDVDPGVTIGSFKVGREFSVKDYVVFSMTPTEPHKAAFRETRFVTPVRLTTDSWIHQGAPGYAPSRFSIPSNPSEEDPDDYLEALPQLGQ